MLAGPRSLWPRYRRHAASRSRGQALLEFALILPVFMLLFAGALDLGRLYASQIAVANAAREGALEAAQNPTSFEANQPCNGITNRVMCRALGEATGSFVTITPGNVSLTCNPACDDQIGYTATVRVEAPFTLLTPILSPIIGGQTITLGSSQVAAMMTAPDAGPTPSPSPSPTPDPSATATPIPTPSPTPPVTPAPTPSPSGAPTPSPTPACTVLPTAQFSLHPNSGKKKRDLFTVTDQSTFSEPACPITTWSWSWGDAGAGSTSNLQFPPDHEYQAQGQYIISLVVTNGAGTSAPFTRTVTVTP
ncbi:MAG TPA: TadE/TadG family type IV pilus assembly protein [Candidatus Limnocylindrales bacterium]